MYIYIDLLKLKLWQKTSPQGAMVGIARIAQISC